MIVFENPGEIDVAAISTFGVSVKESDNPIGFFGTGLKYAIAILLRTNHKVAVYTGMTRCDFGIQTAPVRGRMFDFVTMSTDGGEPERLGFTTEVGKTWEIWMAYRELFCNARDEYGDASLAREAPEPEADKTFVVVEGNEFESVHALRWQYLIEDEPDHEVDGIQIFERPSHHFFYRGVRVGDLPYPSAFTFNETQAMELTEDRTAKDAYGIPWRIARAMLKLTDDGLIRRMVTGPERSLERQLDFHGWNATPTPEFLRVVGQLTNDGITDVNPTARKLWEEKQPKEFNPKIVTLTDIQRQTLARAVTFCECIGFPIAETYPVIVAESLGTDTLGLAKNKTIYLAERAFLMGTKTVAGTLIEEYVHLRHSHVDCTRAMQNWLVDRLVSLGEEAVGEPL